MSFLRFCEWLASTPGSIALHESRYVFLAILTVHVLTLALFVGTALMIDLRLLGVTLSRVPVYRRGWATMGIGTAAIFGSI